MGKLLMVFKEDVNFYVKGWAGRAKLLWKNSILWVKNFESLSRRLRGSAVIRDSVSPQFSSHLSKYLYFKGENNFESSFAPGGNQGRIGRESSWIRLKKDRGGVDF